MRIIMDIAAIIPVMLRNKPRTISSNLQKVLGKSIWGYRICQEFALYRAGFSQVLGLGVLLSGEIDTHYV